MRDFVMTYFFREAPGPSSVEEEKYDDVDDVETEGDFGESQDNDDDEQGLG